MTEKHRCFHTGLIRSLALVLAALMTIALFPLAASADGDSSAQTAVVQVVYASPDGNFAFERVNVSPQNNVVAPNPERVPAGYVGVNVHPVTLIFNRAGSPIPNVIYFTYQQGQVGHSIQVNYATTAGVFASGTASVTVTNNVVTPNASLVPAGYLPLSANPVTIPFDQSGRPLVTSVTFYYYQNASQNNTGSTGSFTLPQQITAGWRVPGQVVVFGQYEQDNNTQNGKEPVEWIVLRVEGTRALLLSRYALDTQRFHSEWVKISWKDCSLRRWLNSTFYNECFSDTQRGSILRTTIQSNYVNSSVQTQDDVFCLSADECRQYLNANLLRCTATRYAAGQQAATKDGYCYWQLRDTTNRKNDNNRVEPNGDILEYGSNTNAAGVAVRPAIWVNVATAFGY
ncbi:MAG: hypothetical protein IKC28_04640 [Clostridia bacterium]|nr:hypothetical protein [Clostridia bacterium]